MFLLHGWSFSFFTTPALTSLSRTSSLRSSSCYIKRLYLLLITGWVTWSYTQVTILFLSSRIVRLGFFLPSMLLKSAGAAVRLNWNFCTTYKPPLESRDHLTRARAFKAARFHGNSSGSCFRVSQNIGPRRSSTRHRSLYLTENKT